MNERFTTPVDYAPSSLAEQERVGNMMRNIGGWAMSGISRAEFVGDGYVYARSGEDAREIYYVAADGRQSPVIRIPKVRLDVLA